MVVDFFCVVYDVVVCDLIFVIDNFLRCFFLVVIFIIKKMLKYVFFKVFVGYFIKCKVVYLFERIKVKMKVFKIFLVWCCLFYCVRLFWGFSLGEFFKFYYYDENCWVVFFCGFFVRLYRVVLILNFE